MSSAKTDQKSAQKSYQNIEPRLVEKPWGGRWLGQRYGSISEKIGEAWLLSTLPEGESELDGSPLSKALGRPLSFVVKIIDAQENLSVQVHPNDEWAAKLENSRGKTECWLILEAKPGAGVYMGLRDGITPQEFEDALASAASVENLVGFFPVQRGDFIIVPAGAVHAIGSGVTLLEVQQASGITYRLWDWNRAGRELHLEKGLKVTDYKMQIDLKSQVLDTQGLLFDHADFACWINEAKGDGWFIDLESYEVYRATSARSQKYIFVQSKF